MSNPELPSPAERRRPVSLTINGNAVIGEIEPRLSLADFIRHQACLTGTHVGCEQGSCGACTVQLDGVPVRSCLVLAVQAEGHEVRTVEDLETDGELSVLQEAFCVHHGLQCGFCTPGMLMTAEPLVANGVSDRETIRTAISGNICRCTGYQQIIDAIQSAATQTHLAGS